MIANNNQGPRMAALGDVFTEDQLNRAVVIFETTPRDEFHARVLREVIEPALPEINRKTGQKNDARYWAYMLFYVFTQGMNP